MEKQLLINKPTGLFALIKLTLSIYKQFFWQIFFGVVITALTLAIGVNFFISDSIYSKVFGVTSIISHLIISTICGLMLFKTTLQLCQGLDVDWKDAFKTARGNFWKCLGAILLILVSLMPILLLFFVSVFIVAFLDESVFGYVLGGIFALFVMFLAARFMLNSLLIFPVIFAEGSGIRASWRRSKSLMKGYCLRFMMVLFLLITIGLFIEFVGNMNLLGQNLFVNVFTKYFLSTLISFIYPIFYMLYYFDMRVRKENTPQVLETIEAGV